MTIAFGHGLSVTPMHVAGGVAPVVTGGLKGQPTLVKREEAVVGVRLLRRRLLEVLLEGIVGKGGRWCCVAVAGH